MRTLGLDPSLRSYGWAIHDSLATGPFRRVSSGHEGTLPSTVPVARFLHFQSLVDNLINKYHPDAIGIESPAYSAGPFQTVHFGLMMFSLVPIFEARLNCVLFDPATLKSLAKEDPTKKKGDMSKLDMQRRVQIDTMDPHVIDNNEADAYLVGLYTARLIELIKGSIPIECLTPAERRIFVLRTKKIKTLKGKKICRIGHIFRENNRYFNFSNIPLGIVTLPEKSQINPKLLEYLENLEETE
jgi:Holliday junction resolvasome RuvABC endonuclease subunit